MAAMLVAIGAATQACAGSVQRGVSNRNVSIQTVVQFGDDVQPVTNRPCRSAHNLLEHHCSNGPNAQIQIRRTRDSCFTLFI